LGGKRPSAAMRRFVDSIAFESLTMAYHLKHKPAFDIPLNDEELRLIGIICGLWSQIEISADILIMQLAEIRTMKTLRALLDRKDMSAKAELLKVLAKHYDKGRIQLRVRQICASISHWGQKRNSAVHGLWSGPMPATDERRRQPQSSQA
jgi:hypothetical protein